MLNNYSDFPKIYKFYNIVIEIKWDVDHVDQMIQ